MVMLPDARDTKEYQTAVRSIQLIGGDVALSDAAGQFAWKLATPDVYEIIAVTQRAHRRRCSAGRLGGGRPCVRPRVTICWPGLATRFGIEFAWPRVTN